MVTGEASNPVTAGMSAKPACGEVVVPTRHVHRLLEKLAARTCDLLGLVQLLLARVECLSLGQLPEPPPPPDSPGQMVTASRRPVRGPNDLPVWRTSAAGRKLEYTMH